MLRRIHLLRKLQTREDHLPGRFGEVGGGPAGRFGPFSLPLLVVQLLHLVVGEEPRSGPLLGYGDAQAEPNGSRIAPRSRTGAELFDKRWRQKCT